MWADAVPRAVQDDDRADDAAEHRFHRAVLVGQRQQLCVGDFPRLGHDNPDAVHRSTDPLRIVHVRVASARHQHDPADTVGRELRKLLYYLPRLVILLLLTLIPVVNLVASPLLLVFGVWMMAVQYIDYQADNEKVSFIDTLRWMRGRRGLSLGFGFLVYIGMLIPLVNLLVMPSAVAGSTLLWIRERRVQPS